MKPVYVVATTKSWNVEHAIKLQQEQSEVDWVCITDKHDLTHDRLAALAPRYVFFPHWSWIIPRDIFDQFECVVFHMTDLPYGRGGSPLQNLIVRGKKETKISALRVVEALDAGPIYMKKDVSLDGSAEAIFRRASDIIFAMIREMVQIQPTPVAQTGDVVEFIRRKPQDGDIGSQDTLEGVYDYIRMLDAEGYPSAFVEKNKWRYEFTEASLGDGFVEAKVVIKPKDL